MQVRLQFRSCTEADVRAILLAVKDVEEQLPAYERGKFGARVRIDGIYFAVQTPRMSPETAEDVIGEITSRRLAEIVNTLEPQIAGQGIEREGGDA